MAGDGLAQDMPAAFTEGGGDPENVFLIVLTGGTYHLDDVGLAQREGSGLVECQGAEPADLFEELAPLDQHAAPRRGGQAADNGDRRGDDQAQGQAMTRMTSPL